VHFCTHSILHPMAAGRLNKSPHPDFDACTHVKMSPCFCLKHRDILPYIPEHKNHKNVWSFQNDTFCGSNAPGKTRVPPAMKNNVSSYFYSIYLQVWYQSLLLPFHTKLSVRCVCVMCSDDVYSWVVTY
jgi:hypothetical protein